MPAGKVPVISEYGIFRDTSALVRSQSHALYIAKVALEYVRLGSPYIQKHCLIDWYSSGADSLGPTQQAVIQAVPEDGASTVTGVGAVWVLPDAERVCPADARQWHRRQRADFDARLDAHVGQWRNVSVCFGFQG